MIFPCIVCLALMWYNTACVLTDIWTVNNDDYDDNNGDDNSNKNNDADSNDKNIMINNDKDIIIVYFIKLTSSTSYLQIKRYHC